MLQQIGSDQILQSNESISSFATIDFAYLSNKYLPNSINDLIIDNVIEIEPYDLSLLDFTSCFYYTASNNFNINLANKRFVGLMLNNQKYLSGGKSYTFNLLSQCLKAYALKHKISENTISAYHKISSANEVIRSQSLATNVGIQTALSWDLLLNNLLLTGQIIHTGDTDNEARISCKLTYIYHLEIINVTISIIFTYNIKVPGYLNVNSIIENSVPHKYTLYEENSLENIKKELQESLAMRPTVAFNTSSYLNHNSNINDNENINLSIEKPYDDDISIGGESTIKTCALLKEITNGLFHKDDEYEVEDDEEEEEEEDDLKQW